MKTLEKLAREAGGFVGPNAEGLWMFEPEDLARFRAACRAEALEEAAQTERRVECDACPTVLGCLGKCMKAAQAEPPAPSPRLLDLLRRAYDALPDCVDGSLDELFAEIELELGIQPDDGN